jgi:hypothetical protein
MQISRSLSLRVEARTGKGTDNGSAAEMESETGERIEKRRAELIAGTIGGNFVTGDSVAVSGFEVFCTIVCDADGGQILLFNL